VTGDLDKLLAEAGQADRVDAGAFRILLNGTAGTDEKLTEDFTASAELLTGERALAPVGRRARL